MKKSKALSTKVCKCASGQQSSASEGGRQDAPAVRYDSISSLASFDWLANIIASHRNISSLRSRNKFWRFCNAPSRGGPFTSTRRKASERNRATAPRSDDYATMHFTDRLHQACCCLLSDGTGSDRPVTVFCRHDSNCLWRDAVITDYPLTMGVRYNSRRLCRTRQH